MTLDPIATRRVVDKVVAGIRNKVSRWVAMRSPTAPAPVPAHAQRGRPRFGLRELTDLAAAVRSLNAHLVSWRRLPTRDGIMEARWSDGTIGYKDRLGRIWLR